jgi:hypothetical protein
LVFILTGSLDQHAFFPFLLNPMAQDLPIPLSEVVHFSNKSDSHYAMSKTEASQSTCYGLGLEYTTTYFLLLKHFKINIEH